MKHALLTRLCVFILIVTSNQLIPTFSIDNDKSVLQYNQCSISVLDGFTRWDAARFLTLAQNPDLRSPRFHSSDFSQESCSNADGHHNECIVELTSVFDSSEQSHAFFPMFPTLVRGLALIAGNSNRDESGECGFILSALVLNLLCFVLSSVVLFDMTILLCLPHGRKIEKSHIEAAELTCYLFMFNPASIFFTVAYSESLFCAMTFVGHYVMLRNDIWWGFEVLPFIAASFTRSNGSLNIIPFIVRGLGRVLTFPYGHSKSYILRNKIGILISNATCVFLILLPIYIHDHFGYTKHCNDNIRQYEAPQWCNSENRISSFYGYVQRKHWNVGLFNYWEIKQLPQFLLASPILTCGFVGGYLWIKRSYDQFENEAGDTTKNVLARFVHWVIYAFHKSVNLQQRVKYEKDSAIDIDYLKGPNALPHYAVLMLSSIIGLLFAHVQITTRMVCSTCPALYWLLSSHLLHLKEPKSVKKNRSKRITIHGLVWGWFCLYNILGAIMHVNWLPWT